MKLTKLTSLFVAALLALSPFHSFAKSANKNAKPHKTVVKKATKQKKATLQVAKKSVKTAKKVKAVSQSNTQSVFGIKGIALKPSKVSNSRYSYRVRGYHQSTMGKESSRQYSQVGIASYYGGIFHGRKTASGEIFNKHAFTAAHKTLALGSYALVTNLRNGRKVIVKVNDRGPFHGNRILDLSLGAAKELRMVSAGTAKVKIEAIHVGSDGYISGKGAASLLALAKREGLSINTRGSGSNLAFKINGK